MRLAGRVVLWGLASIGLAALVVPFASGRGDILCHKTYAAQAQLRQVSYALQVYHSENGRFPSVEQGLSALVRLPKGSSSSACHPQGGYLSAELIVDPWGIPIRYYPSDHDAFIVSRGIIDNAPSAYLHGGVHALTVTPPGKPLQRPCSR